MGFLAGCLLAAGSSSLTALNLGCRMPNAQNGDRDLGVIRPCGMAFGNKIKNK